MDKMKNLLCRMWENPSEKAFFYSANGKPTASPKINALPAWDWTPEISMNVSGSNTALFPLALGCRPRLTSEGKEWFEPLISDAADVAQFVVPDTASGRAGEVLENARKLAAELPPGARIRNPDIQSPLGIAELIWSGDTFYLALVEAPKAVHELLDKITGFLITFIKRFREIAGPKYNPCGFPQLWAEGPGTMVADDTMSLISPEMHLEFSVPYVNRIARECGPLFYHSCTWRRPYYDNIRRIENAVAYNWNLGNSDDPAELIEAFSGRAVLALHLAQNMHRDPDMVKLGRNFGDEADLLAYVLDNMRDNTALYCWFSNVVEKKNVIEKIYGMLAERGYTPAAQGIF